MPDDKLRDAIRTSNKFAAFFALIALARAIGGVFVGAAIYMLALGPALAYALFFLLALGLQLSGAVTRDLKVNPWFAWAVCGGFVFFWVGLLTKGHGLFATKAEILRAGVFSAFAWIACVLIVWLVSWAWSRRGA